MINLMTIRTISMGLILKMLVTSCQLNGAEVVVNEISKDFETITDIEVKGEFCQVTIDAHKSDKVTLTGQLKASKETDEIYIQTKQEGNTLIVWIERPNFGFNVSGYLNFLVPTNTNINVENSSGSVNVSNTGQDKVNLTTSSGSIKAVNIKGNMQVEASSGSINLSEITGNINSTTSSGGQSINMVGGNATCKASSGSLSISNIKGKLTAKTSSGSLVINNIGNGAKVSSTSGSSKITKVTGDVTANSSSGSIKLQNISGALSLNSSSGSQYGSQIQLTGNSSFTSSSGKIKMTLLNNSNDLRFNLTATSGTLIAKGKQGKKSLNYGEGQILVTGESSSGSQIFD